MIDIEYYKQNAIVTADDVAFTYEAVDNPRDFDANRSTEVLDWTDRSFQMDDYTVYPYGSNNDLPKLIKDVVQNNSIAPGILKKKSQLLWGKGPKLYIEKYVDGVLVREWKEDKEIQQWLDSWEYEDYLSKCGVDYHHAEGVMTKFHQSRAARIGGSPKIAKLEQLNLNRTRLAKKSSLSDNKPTHCMFTEDKFVNNQINIDYKVYPLFKFSEPFKNKTAILYSNMYSFCSDYYTVPDIYGSLEWLRNGSATPLILTALSKNSINLKYHITSPQAFWDQKKKELEDKAIADNKKYKESDLIAYRTDFLRQISKVLSGAENTGKFWHSVKYTEIDGMKIFEHGWEIKEIKQNIKDFVTAQIAISDKSDRAISASVGLHTALGGGGDAGKSDSGSEQLYALKNYLITGIDIPEMIVCKAINYAIKANWPDKGIKLGFYHIAPQREEDVSSKERTKEQV